MRARVVIWTMFVAAGAPTAPPEASAQQTEAPDPRPSGETSQTTTTDDPDEDEAPAPPPPKKPPDGLLPVTELARVELSPRDRPRALLYGNHMVIVGRTGLVQGHDAATGEFEWKLGLPGEDLFDPVIFEAGPLVEGETDAFTVVLSAASGHLLIVDGLTGAIQRETRLPFELALPPIRGSGDIVFLATPSGDIVSYDVRRELVVFQRATDESPLALASTDTLLVVSGGIQTLTALDLPSGALRWRFRGRAAFHAPAAFDEDATRVYVGDDAGELYCLGAGDGGVKFRWSTGAAIRARALVERNRLYVTSWANTLFAFNASSGDEHWRANLPGRPATGPMRIRNRLLVGTYDGILIEVNPARGQPGKQYVAPGELVSAPSLFSAKPNPEEIASQAEATDPGTRAEYEEEDPSTELDPDIFGPQELAELATTSEDDEPEVPLEDPEAGTGDPEDAVVPVEIPAEPAWFERSRIALALRTGEVLLLAHQAVEPAVPLEEGDEDLETPDPTTEGEADDSPPPSRPPTSSSRSDEPN